ncbi:MAG: hypothetical protein ABUL53_13415 [Bradyrhizobium guangdongense]
MLRPHLIALGDNRDARARLEALGDDPGLEIVGPDPPAAADEHLNPTDRFDVSVVTTVDHKVHPISAKAAIITGQRSTRYV